MATAVETVLTIALGVIAAQLAWSLVEPTSSVASPSGVTIRESRPAMLNVAVLTTFDPFHRSVPSLGVATPRAPETMLNLTLFGIRSDAATGNGSVIIGTPDKKQDVYAIGAEIMPGVRLEKIFADHVVIRRNGVSEKLSFDRTGTELGVQTPPATANNASATAKAKAELGASIREFLTQARLTERGNVQGVVLEGDAAQPFLRQTGLEAGDVLLSINGAPLGNPSAVASLATAGLTELSLEVERKGQRKIHKITIDR